MGFQQGPMGFQQGPMMPNFGPPPGFPPGQGMPDFGPPPGNQQWQSDPGMPWFGPPGTQGQQGQQGPQGPPPNFSPPYPAGGAQLLRVDPGAISGCLHRFTYVWLSRRQGFWFFPTFVGRTSVAGYRWRSRQRRWEYFGIDLNRIDSFSCF
nr:hypothetical protein [Sporosarcina limicola]